MCMVLFVSSLLFLVLTDFAQNTQVGPKGLPRMNLISDNLCTYVIISSSTLDGSIIPKKKKIDQYRKIHLPSISYVNIPLAACTNLRKYFS